MRRVHATVCSLAQLTDIPCQIAPMRWPADLQYGVWNRKYAAGWLARRRELGQYLETLMPVMSSVLAGATDVDEFFSGLIREGMRSHGYNDDGEAIPGASQSSVSCQDFFNSRTKEWAGGIRHTDRKLLDAGDEALITYLANKLGEQQPIGSIFDRLYVKTATAGRVYFAYAALEWYTGVPRADMARTIEYGGVLRPESRWELAWGAYARLANRGLQDTHRVITPRLEVPPPVKSHVDIDESTAVSVQW